ncbi:unnamed protein product [Protopolystoma xenopodis]|uniref:BTB domain-containing protein n=1 Tax=Protopolystoma xenopodis TaxID=117903 RepID=A0A3S5BKP6_9PLAT|nr:unnamed protein product [Protopolystoma xenopodis]
MSYPVVPLSSSPLSVIMMRDSVEDFPMNEPISQSHEFSSSIISGPAGLFYLTSNYPNSTATDFNQDACSTANFNVNDYPSESLNVMYTLFQAGKLCDVTLRVNSEKILCHRIVLAGASPYFRAMFTNGMLEAEMPEINIHYVSALALDRLVRFAYTGQIHVNELNVCEILTAATMLQMSHVVGACSTFLENQLHPSNAIGIEEFARSNGCIVLAQKSQTYIYKNFSDIVKHDEFLCLKLYKLINMIKRDELSVKTEAEVYNAVIRWANHDRAQRISGLIEALSFVRCHNLSPTFIQSQIKNCSLLASACQAKEYLQCILNDLVRHRGVSDRRRTAGYSQVKCLRIWIIYSAGGYLRLSLSTFECYNPSGTWHHLPSIPSPRSGLAACSIRGCIYLVGGRNNNGMANVDAPHVDCYDPGVNKWHTCAPMSVPRNRVAVGIIDDMIYAIGGSTNTMHHNTGEK